MTISLSGKSFKEVYYLPLLSAFIKLDSAEDRPKVIELCEQVYMEHKHRLTKFFKGVLGFMFFKIGRPSKTVNLLSDEIDFNLDTEEHRIYILASWQTGKDFKALFNLLENWRKYLPPDAQSTEIEVNLFNELRNHPMTEKVAQYGTKHFPKNPIYTVRLIDALNWQGKREELIPLLDAGHLMKFDLNWRTLFQLGNVCFVNELYEQGLDLYYNGLKKEINNPLVREIYLMNLSSYTKIDEMPYPEIAGEGMVVRILSEQKETVIELTPGEIAYKPLVKSILGRRIDEQFTLRDSVTGRSKDYIVAQILDKFRGQFALFVDWIAKNPEGGIHLRSISFDQNEPDSFLKSIQEELGEVGTERKIFKNVYLEQFLKREIGFTQLFRFVFDDTPLVAWQYITSLQSDGFPIVPLMHQPNWQIDSSSEFVLDFSSLFTLFHISQGENLNANGKPFIISQVLKEYIQSAVIECEIRRKSYISVDVSMEGIVPYFLTEQQVDQQIQFYKNLLAWMNDHCTTDLDPEILSIKRDPKFESRKIDLHHLCAIDTVQLARATNRILLSDDLLHYKKNTIIKVMTLEHFMLKYHQQAYSEKYSYNLIKLNYRGLTLTSDHLSKCFGENQLLVNGQSDFYLALNSFSVVHNAFGLNIYQALKFIRDIYAGSLGLPFKRQVSSTTLHYLLADLEITHEVLEMIEININELFFLMRDHFLHVKEDVTSVLEAKYLSQSNH